MSHVYFIQEGLDGPIKIGVAENPDRRLKWLQCGNPNDLYLRALLTGGVDLERELHGMFSLGSIRGEWFRAETPGLAEVMQLAQEQEFWPEDILCQRCDHRPVARGRRKYCKECA